MADQAVNDNQNVHFPDANNNNVGDNKVGNDNDMDDPGKDHKYGLTVSSSTRSQPCDDDYHPP